MLIQLQRAGSPPRVQHQPDQTQFFATRAHLVTLAIQSRWTSLTKVLQGISDVASLLEAENRGLNMLLFPKF